MAVSKPCPNSCPAWQVLEVAVSLCSSVVDRLLGLTSGRDNRLRRFYIGRWAG